MNHIYQGHFDIFTLPSLGLPKNTHIVHIPLVWPVGSVLKLLDGIQIETRNGGAYESFMTQCMAALQKGDNLLIFPEAGTPRTFRNRHVIPPYRSGTFELALKTGCLIVPIVRTQDPNFIGFLYPASYSLTFLPAIDPSRFRSAHEMREYTWNQMSTFYKSKTQT